MKIYLIDLLIAEISVKWKTMQIMETNDLYFLSLISIFLLFGIACGKIVSRSVIEYISQNQNAVCALLLECLKGGNRGVKIAVNIRTNQKLHNSTFQRNNVVNGSNTMINCAPQKQEKSESLTAH